MAISSVTITQDNIVDSVNLLSIHNPLVFIADAAYTGSIPDFLNVKLYDKNDVLLDTFACIPYADSTGVRRFAFLANDILKGYMGALEDFASVEKVIEYVPNATTIFKLKFYDPDSEATYDEVTFVAMHAARQIGETPYLESIYNNESETYYTGQNMPAYAYFYNDNELNIITVGTGEIIFRPLNDYDDYALLDFDDQYLLSL